MWTSPLRALGTLGILVIVAGGAVLMILPFYWMLVTALSPATDVMAFPPKWVPSHVTFEHVWYAVRKAPWHLYYWNSLVVAVVSVGCSLLFGLFAGYAFAVYRFPLQNVLFLLILSTLMVSGPGHLGGALHPALAHRLGGHVRGDPGAELREAPSASSSSARPSGRSRTS